jgi:hypothetical protein
MPSNKTSSAVIFKNRTYTACAMHDGSLIVTKNKTQEGRRLIGDNAPYWIDNIKTAIDPEEAASLCRALFVS